MRALTPIARTLFYSFIAAAFVLVAASEPGSAARYKPKADEDWTTYKHPRFGFRLYYPADIFEAEQSPEGENGLRFTSDDGKAQIVTFGAINNEDLSPSEYRRVLLEDFGGYDQLDYNPKGRTWFVLSGFRGGNTYYQKVMFSCSNKLINVFSVTFPSGEKEYYERLIEIMEDRFKPGRGADAPVKC